MGNNIKLQDLDLSLEEEGDIIEFIARKRGISTKKLLSTIKPNPKPKNNQNLTTEKPLKNSKPKNNQNLPSKNKERIGIIREELKELTYKLSKSELKETKRRLYIVENKKGSLNSKKTRKYLNELDKKILKLDRYHQDYDDSEYRGIEDLRDLFKLSINEDYYKPTLAKSGFNNNYIH